MEGKNRSVIVIFNFALSGWMAPLLKAYLSFYGYDKTHLIRYHPDMGFSSAMEDVDKKIQQVANKKEDKIFVIGLFFGGLIANNLHRLGWKIRKGIYVASPMQGPSAYETIRESSNFFKYADSEPYEWISAKDREEEPPHEFHTISLGLWNSNNDGLLRKVDTMIDGNHHTHVKWTSRWTPFFTPPLFSKIYSQLQNLRICTDSRESTNDLYGTFSNKKNRAKKNFVPNPYLSDTDIDFDTESEPDMDYCYGGNSVCGVKIEKYNDL